MDISNAYSILFPLSWAVIGYQFKLLWGMQNAIQKLSDASVSDSDVRQIVTDNLKVLHVTDSANEARIDNLENRLNRIDDKLDRIIALVGHNNNN